MLRCFGKSPGNGRDTARILLADVLDLRRRHPTRTRQRLADGGDELLRRQRERLAQGIREALKARQDQGRFFWELRSCAYYDKFEEKKILYQVIQYPPTILS